MSAPVRIHAEVIGAGAVIRRFNVAAEETKKSLADEVQRLTIELQRRVKEGKLTGQVLHVKTGRLRRSVNVKFTKTDTAIYGSVGTNVKYGRTWELGFTVPAHDIVPKNKLALFWPGADHPVRRVHRPEKDVAARPFLAPALAEMKAQVQARLLKAALGAI